MTSVSPLSQILLSCAVMAFVAATASSTADAQGTGPGPLERRAKLEAPDNRVPRRTRYTPPERPAVNSPPLIVEREILGFFPVLEGRSPAPADYQAFVNSALNAVRQWQYAAPANGPIAFDVTFGFAPSSVHVLWEGLAAPALDQEE